MNTGVACVAAFVAASALRDVFFAGAFQQFRFFDVVLVSFGLASVTFLGWTVWFRPGQLRALGCVWRDALMCNLLTAGAWLCYFQALKILEPSLVNMLHAGIGSVTLIGMAALGIHIARPVRIAAVERATSLGVLASLGAAGAVVTLGLSGLPLRAPADNLLGLGLALASGIFIALASAVSTRMNERGVTPEGVLAVRFWAVVLVAAVAVGAGPGLPLDPSSLGGLALASLVLIVLPVYVLQIGLARISAASAWIIIALGPSLVFVAQLLDGRVRYSPWSLVCIAAYTAFAVAGNAVRRFEKAA